ncbi:MAG TPA: hypothetical protein VMU33_12630 [Burkholderiaceae bacterium]|nr:hypothetical protein [Burkholderiaceae bacterium]
MKIKPLSIAAAAAGLLSLALSSAAAAGDIYLIANHGTSITLGDAHDVYLGDKQFAGSVKLVPVDNSAVQDAFLAKVLKMDAAKYGSAWTKKSFRDGLTPPAVKGSDIEVIDFVKRSPGAVGYVGSAPAGVDVIGKF